jgi:hypothetical protein
MTRLLVLLGAFASIACFRTVIPGPDGKSVAVKTPCDAAIWATTKHYGKPDQVVLSDDQPSARIRFYYSATRTEYGFGWYDVTYPECSTWKRLHLTGDGIQ